MIRKCLAVSALCMLCKIDESSCLTQEGRTRRAFLNRVPCVAAASGAAFFLNLGDHDSTCGCPQCQIGPQVASAYETKEIGGADRSAATAAMNRQAIETNNRLERSGFKLDTAEEEKARLSDALSSFSYDSSPSKKTGPRQNSSSQSKVSDSKTK
jgi:hypothetical protein